MTILGLGTAVPDTVVNGEDALQIAHRLRGNMEACDWLNTIYKNSSIKTRRYSLGAAVVRDLIEGTDYSHSPFLPKRMPGERGPTTKERIEHYAELAPPLALRAAQRALEQSGLKAKEITHLVTVSCTGFQAPGVDHFLIERLGLFRGIERVHVGYMGCHGAINGLRVARAFADANPRAHILVCAVELCCLHGYYGNDPQKVIGNSLFTDGAAALIVSRADPKSNDWSMSGSGSYVFPDSKNAMQWVIGNYGFEMTLSKQVPTLIAANLRPWLQQWLDSNGLELEHIASWAVHPGGPKILDEVEHSLQLPERQLDQSRAILAEYGNMSSPTILFILERLRQTNAPRPCVAIAFGPGLVVEAALFE